MALKLKYSLGLMLALIMAPAFAADPIKIGLSGPFTGGSASMGVSMRDGARLAVSEINAAGGVLGRPLQLVERDDEARNELDTHGWRTEYIEVRRRSDLAPIRPGDRELVVLGASWLGSARLIDNLEFDR